MRPYCIEFLKRMSRIFEIAIYTASTQPYCDPIVAEIDKHRVISHLLYRNHCNPVASKEPQKPQKIAKNPKISFFSTRQICEGFEVCGQLEQI